MARVTALDQPDPSDEGSSDTADLVNGVSPPPPGVKEEARDLVAALMHERALMADDADLRRMAGELLAAGHTVERAAALLGLRPATLWSWMADPALRQAKRMGVEFVRARVFETMLGGTLESVSALVRDVQSPATDPETKLRIFEALADRTGFAKPDKRGGERQVIDVTFSRRLAAVAGKVAVVDGSGEEADEEEEEGDESEEG